MKQSKKIYRKPELLELSKAPEMVKTSCQGGNGVKTCWTGGSDRNG